MDSKYHDRRRTCVCYPRHKRECFLRHRVGGGEFHGVNKLQRLHCKRYNQGHRSHEDVAASTEKLKINTNVEANIPSARPIKENVTAGTDITWRRYLENLCLLGMAWVRKVQHVARLTLNSPTGPVWPTYIEPLALELFAFLESCSIDWTRVRERADFADEIDLAWRANPLWLPEYHKRYIPIWEYVTGMARTWGLNCHQNKGAASRHHVVSGLRVRNIANYIRTNKFYRVGDDETACERPESSPRCRESCHHTKSAQTLERLKRKPALPA